MFKQLYHDEKVTEGDGTTVYTNHTTAGAMRGYGIPQSDFFAECLMEDLARKIGVDPLEFRLKNCLPVGYVDPGTGIPAYSNGLRECVAKGRELFHWDEKRKAYEHQTGDRRRGVGVALFDYKTGVYPISLEVSNCRIFMNEDGSLSLQMGRDRDRAGRGHGVHPNGCAGHGSDRAEYPYRIYAGYGRRAL